MSRRQPPTLVPDLEARVQAYRPRTRGVGREVFRSLALAVLKRADETFLLEDGGTRWLRQVEALAAHALERPDGEPLVSVHPPDSRDRIARTVVQTCMPDQPFIVDSILLCFEQRGYEVLGQVNMILATARGPKGRLREVGGEASESRPLESFAHFEITPITHAAERRRLRDDLLERLRMAQATVADFRRMLRQMKDLQNQLEFVASLRRGGHEEFFEGRSFLEWLADEHFVFLGVTPVDRSGRMEEGRLGIDRLLDRPLAGSYAATRAQLKGKALQGPPVQIHKTAEESRLHRRGKVDEILVRRYDDRGRVAGTFVVHGLFTHRALTSRASSVPILRRMLAEMVRREGLSVGSYNYKSLVNAFNALPVEYLFGAEIEDALALIREILDAERARRVRVHVSRGEAGRSAFVFVVMPSRSFTEELRERIEARLLGLLGANYSDHRVLMSTYGVAVVHFYMTSAREIPDLDEAVLTQEIVEMSATWEDRLREALVEVLEQDDAVELYRRYHRAFSQRYCYSTPPEQAVGDLLLLERVRAGAGLQFRLYRDEEDRQGGTMKLRLYEAQDMMLSDILPVLDNFGLRVVSSFVNHARLADGSVITLDTFRFRLEPEALADDEGRQRRFIDALAAVFGGRMANDALNRILLPADLSWPQVDLLRSYQGYGRQLGHPVTPGSVWCVLVDHAGIVRQLVRLFEARFGPGKNGRVPATVSPARKRACAKLRQDILESLDHVQGYNEDRILRLFLALIDATLRTSYFAKEKVHPSIAMKFDGTRVPSLIEPRPWREIYVHHANLAGVHLRGGRIARGGLRWSDRPDDFRTEIHGLMTTQMVKNVVIVPLGAKGGFVVRRLPADPAERRKVADAHYEIFIHALLDLTDNLVDGKTVRPADVVCWDDPDPYLVVAADKGTAHLSDTANRISQERGFWLGDAFASGGSHGYDHKAIGITARGAWVCIRHHLRELGIDADKDVFTAVGIGDMGGDVFGNGMLEHRTIRLLAAFNHLHIFLDPDPDPEESFRERRRLFRARYGGWDAYDPEKISRGGGVFDRHAKKISLSPAVRKMLGTEETEMSGNEVVCAILQMPVDLWYNGGIGTYVKASHETHAAAVDPSNDAVRIDASELQARVVGEGGNLGLTQAARIEFAARGGKINTDFIDNAGGVNTSDHEVNLKILFSPLMAAGRLSFSRRNRVLQEVESQVVHDVLEANAEQARLLSLDERRSKFDLAPFDGVMGEVTRYFEVKRTQLHLPSAREMDRRMAEGEALTRPELATLAAYVKMQLYQQLLEDPELDMEGLLPAVRNYFPEPVRKRFRGAVDEHPLRREIALTRLTNRVVDHTGCTFFHAMAADCGANSRQTFQAYSMLSRAADLWEFKDGLWALGWKVEVETLYRAWLIVEQALSLGTRHLLEHWTEDRVVEALRNTRPYARKLRELSASIESILDPVSLERVHNRTVEFSAAGVPRPMAARLAQIRYLPRALVVLDLAGEAGRPVKAVARDYFAIGRQSRLFEILHWIDELRPTAYYDALAYRALRRELHELLSQIVLKLLPVPGSAAEKLASLGPAGQTAFERLERLGPDERSPAALMVVASEVRTALGRA